MTAMHDSDNHDAKLLQALGGLGVHAHLCLIYETREEQFAALVPFIRIGLERGERCVYIADDNTAAVVLDALAAQVLDVASAVASGALMMVGKRETYLQSGAFDPDLMIRFLHDAAEAAKAAGFAALRATGEMTWALGAEPGVERLMEYEAKLNDFFATHDALAICQYNRARFSLTVIRDVLRTHPLVIYGSVVCRNVFYVPPVEWFAPDAASMEVTRLLDGLLARERDEEALRAQTQQQAAVAQLAQRALAGADLSTVMDDAVGLVARTLGVEYVQIGELLPDGQALLLRAGMGWKEGDVGHATVGAGLDSQAGYTLHVREPVIVEDFRSETRFTGPPLLREHGVISGLSTVIQGHARPFGVLSAHTASRRVFSEDAVQVLQAIAHVVATTVARKRMEEALEVGKQALQDMVTRQTALLKDTTETRKAMLGMLEDLNDTNVALRQAKMEWEDTFDAISDPLFIHDRDFKLIKANQAYAQLAGVPRERLLGRPYYDVFPKADGPLAMCRQALELRKATVEEVACPSINKCFSGKFFPIKNAEGQHLYSVYILEDITERKRAETALYESREMLQLILSSIPQYVFWKDRTSRYLGCNTLFAQAAGVSEPAAIVGKEDGELVWSETAELYRADDRWVMETKTPKLNFEEPQTRPDGSVLWLRTSKVPLLSRDGQVIGVLGVYSDITEVKRVEQALRESEEKFRVITDSAQDAILMLDSGGRITYWNKAAEQIFGYPESDALGKGTAQVIARRRSESDYRDDHGRSRPRRVCQSQVHEIHRLHRGGDRRD